MFILAYASKASCLMAHLRLNKKRTPKNVRGSKTFDEKKMHHVLRIRNTSLNTQGAQRPLMKKDASHFTNKKCIPQNARGSKTSDEKRDIVFYE
jgi:hypothetical protein